ncbi:MAG: hypothetical protein ACLP4V_10440 [Methylocella sp.]
MFKPVDEPDAWLRVDLACMPETEEPAAGRFIAFMRDGLHTLGLLQLPGKSL